VQRSPAIADLSGNVLVATASFVVVAGAIYFGLFSCGGYAWHKNAFGVVALGVCAAAVVVPSRLLHSLGRKVLFLLLLGACYFVFEAAAAPFYPSGPESFSQYIQAVLQFAQVGSCS
jgi:hypothetical protein